MTAEVRALLQRLTADLSNEKAAAKVGMVCERVEIGGRTWKIRKSLDLDGRLRIEIIERA